MKQRSKEFEDQVLEHLDMMYAVAMRLTRNAADAEDLTQNTLVKALRFHDKFREGTYIKAWLLTILRNTFINDYRRRTRAPLTVDLTSAETQSAVTEAGNQEHRTASRAELMELLDDPVKDAIVALPPDFRDAVIMSDLEDRSYKEIAEAMDCPIGTVMSRLYRGRKILRDQLADYAREQRVVPREQ